MREYSLPDWFRILCLFGYETQGGKRSPLWQDPLCYLQSSNGDAEQMDRALQVWVRGRRLLRSEEIVDSEWWQEPEEGDGAIIRCKRDGTLIRTEARDEAVD